MGNCYTNKVNSKCVTCDGPKIKSFCDTCQAYGPLIYRLYLKYRETVEHVRQTKFFKERTFQLQSYVERYLENNYNMQNSDIWMRCVDAAHKLHPKDFGNKQIVTKEWLIDACLRQQSFCDKIPLSSFNFQHSLHQYFMRFLVMCKTNTKSLTVPTLFQDMIWHSHMQNNQKYKSDTKQILGFVLDHKDDIPDEKLKQYKQQTWKIRDQLDSKNKKQHVKQVK